MSAELLKVIVRLSSSSVFCDCIFYFITHFCLFQYADSVKVLWRLAKASHLIAMACGAEGNNDKKKEFVLQGLFMKYGNVYHVSDEKLLWNVKMHASTFTPLDLIFEYV